MSKVSEIREICGDYAIDIEYSKDFTFTMYFNSRRNAETVKRCVELDDSVPNVATAVDFVEVVRCKDCVYADCLPSGLFRCRKHSVYSMFRNSILNVNPDDYCSFGERSEQNEG